MAKGMFSLPLLLEGAGQGPMIAGVFHREPSMSIACELGVITCVEA